MKRARDFSFSITRPVLVASALTGEHVEKLFRLIDKIQRAAQRRIGTGVLNRAPRRLRRQSAADGFGQTRLKLFYAAQASGMKDRPDLRPPQFVLFVNDPRLINDTYRRYLEARIREAEPYAGLPILMTLRPRGDTEK